MLAVSLENLPVNRPSGSADSVEPQGDSFGNLLTQVQSQQWNALAGTVAEASTLAAKPNDETSSPRRARIDQETQAARQAEVSSQRTRGADPTSVQNGVVSARHERVLSQQEAANEASVASRAKIEQVESRDSRVLEGAAAETATKTKADSRVDRELERSAGPSRESVLNKPEQIAGRAGAKAASKPDLQTATPATSQAIAVSTAGAARISSVAQAPSSATSAEKIGQLLGGKGQLQPTRAATPSVPVDSQQGASQKNSSQGRSTTARLEQPATSRSSTTDVETTKRSEFESLVKNIRMNRGIKSSSATIRLNPPELGRLKIHAQMKDDALSVRVEAMSASTQSLISERSDELVAALRERGIDVERFEVIRLETEQGSASRDEDGSSTALDQRETDQEEGRQASERTNDRAIEGPRATEATDREFVEDTVGQKAQLDVRV